MNCCIECFCDTHTRAIIKKQKTKGNCDFCRSKGTFVYDVDSESNPIADMIIGLVQIYSISDNVDAKPIEIALCDDWNIFGGEPKLVKELLIALCMPTYSANSDVFIKNVTIPQLMDDNFLREYGVVHGSSWEAFSDSIKYKNRFHSGMFNADIFASFLSIATKNFPIGTQFYRARISKSKSGYRDHEMGAPPKDKRSAGRINPEGVGALYLSSDEITVLNEVRASMFDYIAIGRFHTTRNIKVVDLSGVAQTSPFLYEGEFEQFAANRKVFQEIAAEIAKPLRRSDSSLEYLPTQYISEFIKSQNYDGVIYESTLVASGYNLAVFDESMFKCENVKTIEVTEVFYKTQPDLS